MYVDDQLCLCQMQSTVVFNQSTVKDIYFFKEKNYNHSINSSQQTYTRGHFLFDL